MIDNHFEIDEGDAMPDASNYTINVEWLLTWFPIDTQSTLDAQLTKAGFARHSLDNLTGHGADVRDEFPDVVSGIIRLTVDEGLFLVNIEVNLNNTRRTQSLIARPGGRYAFMLNAVASPDDARVVGTGLSFHGVITTGSRALDRLELLPDRLGR